MRTSCPMRTLPDLSTTFATLLQVSVLLPQIQIRRNVSEPSPKDTQQSLEWNSNDYMSMVPSHETAHNMVSASASKSPDLVVINSWDGSFSYRKLDIVTSKLAGCLISKFGVEIADKIGQYRHPERRRA